MFDTEVRAVERTILHIDCNKFYASVECLHNPEIRDKPVAVGGSREERHGIILTKNEIAAKYGVMTIPTVIVFENGVEKKRSIGVVPKARLTALLD